MENWQQCRLSTIISNSSETTKKHVRKTTSKTYGPHRRQKDMFLDSTTTGTQTNHWPRSDDNSRSQSSSTKTSNKIKKLLAWDFKPVKPKAEVFRQTKDDGRALRSAFMDLCHEACGTCRTPVRIIRKSCAPWRRRQRRRRIQSSIHGARRISFSSGGSNFSGYNFQTSRMAGEANVAVLEYAQVHRLGVPRFASVTEEGIPTRCRKGQHPVEDQNSGTQLTNQRLAKFGKCTNR